MSAFATIRRILTYATVCTLIGAGCVTVHAESDISISGIVIDDSAGGAVDQAQIRIEGTSLSTISGPDGSFEISAVPHGQWSLTVERIGYRPKSITEINVVEGFSRNLRISLTPDPIRVRSQNVESARREEHGVRRINLDREDVRAQSVSQLLERIPGVRVYGSSDSPGGIRVSVGGESGSRVAVMLDGLPLSGGSDGAVDLSSIPVSAISAIEVHSGSQTFIAGDAAVGGAVNLITRTEIHPDGVRVLSAGGDWGRSRQDISFNESIEGLVLSAGGEYDQRHKPYDYHDVKTDTVGARENSRIDERRAFFRFGKSESFELFGYASRNERGAPGSIEQPLPGAFIRNKNGRIQSVRRFNLTESQTVSAAGWYEFSSEYYNATEAKIKQHTYLREHFAGLKIGHQMVLGRADWNCDLETRFRMIHGDNFQVPKSSFGDEDRAELAFRTRLSRTIGRLSLRGGVALDADPDNAPGWSPRADLGFSPVRALSFGAGWGRSFKRPLLVTAFWKGDYYTQGNPDLLPERAEEWDAGVRWRTRIVTVDTRYFERTIDDIVVWDLRGVPQRYTPVNLASGEVIGREDHVGIVLIGGNLTIDYTHVFNDARDHSGQPNYDGQIIPFMPRHTHDCTVRGSSGPLDVSLSGRWVSMRQALRSNTNRWQAPYRVFDAEVRLTPHSQSPHVAVFVRGENLTNEAYELLEGYPSPARTLTGGITIGIQ
jgi:outer membrane cobalamin receptor